MRDKQLEEKRKEFDDLMREWGVLPFSGSAHRAVELWDWIERLVEEVEREKNVEIIKRLKEYQLGLENYIEEYGLNRIESIKVNEFGIKDN